MNTCNGMKSVCGYNMTIIFSCIVGLLLSAYAYHVEVNAEHDEGYNAMCDISEHMSCTKVFTSPYGKGFGFIGKYFGEDSPMNMPNGFLGTIFYGIFGLLSFSNNYNLARLQLLLAALSIISSLRLAYILYFILSDFCVVCVSTYVVNVVNTIFTYRKVKELGRRSSDKKSRKTQ